MFAFTLLSASSAVAAPGNGRAFEHQGLPANVPVPAWAKGKPVHFLPVPENSPSGKSNTTSGKRHSEHQPPGHGEPESPWAEGSTRCEPGYCPTPPLTYLPENLGTQHEPHVHVIFWGSNWNKSPGIETREEVLKFLNGLSGSSYQRILNQYFDHTGRIGMTVSVTSYVDTSVTAPTEVEDQKIKGEANAAIAANGWSQEHDDQFIVMPAPGTTYTISKATFCAYHGGLSKSSYSFVPYMGDKPFDACTGVDANKNPSHTTTFGLSHEYAESTTNPHVGPGASAWTTEDLGHYEVADICPFEDVQLANGTWVTTLWDNHLNDCVAADSSPPYLYARGEAATEVKSHEATFQGSIYPEGSKTQYHFEFGPTTAYGGNTPTLSAEPGGAVDTKVEISSHVSGLELEKTYHYRVVATNSTGTFYGQDYTVKPSQWLSQTVPNPNTSEHLSAVSCPATNSCLAVGAAGKSPVADLWSGTNTWTQVSIPPPSGEPTSVELKNISCSATNFCMAVGWKEAGEATALVERWNGATWTVLNTPTPPGVTAWILKGVSCRSTTFCIAVGQSYIGLETKTLIEKWDGSNWSILSSPNVEGNKFNELRSVSCSSTTECTAVGRSYKHSSETNTLAERWNGSSWSIQSSLNAGESSILEDVTCKSATFCMAVGSQSEFTNGFMELWNGSEWKMIASELPRYLASVTCFSTTSCDAVGQNLGRHWDGAQLSPEEFPEGGPTLNGVDCIGDNACIAVGTSASGIPLALRLNPPWTAHSRYAFGSYPVVATGTQLMATEFAFTAGRQIHCNRSLLAGEAAEATEALSLASSLSECSSYEGGTTTVNTKNCQFILHPGAEIAVNEFAGSVEIGPAGCGPIELIGSICKRSISAQSGLAATYNNTVTETTGTSTIHLLGTMSYTTVEGPSSTCGSGLQSGSILASWVVGAKTPGGLSTSTAVKPVAPVGLLLAGKESAEEGSRPRFEAERYPVSLAGEQEAAHRHVITFEGGRKLECENVGVSGKITAATTSFSYEPQYTNCTALVLGNVEPTVVKPNGCNYTINALNVGPPYQGSLNVACSKEKTAIEVVIYETALKQSKNEPQCIYKIAPQSGLKGVGLSDFGEGRERGVSQAFELSGMKYTRSVGSVLKCGAAESTAAYTGVTTLVGFE
jgi:hypothetical protein